MVPFAAAFPVLPGKEADLRSFVQQMTAKTEQLNNFQKVLGVPKESWHLQNLPNGAQLLVVSLESEGALGMFTQLAGLQDEFATWFKTQVLDLTGVDLNQAMPGSPSEMLFNFYG